MIRKRSLPVSASTAVGIALFSTAMAGEKAASAQSSLPPGTTSGIPVPTISPGTPPFGDTLLEEIQAPISATNGTNIISGTVTSAVFLSSSGFLDFAYQAAFNSSTNVVVDALSVVTFQNVPDLSVAQTMDDIDGSGLSAQAIGGATQNDFTTASSTGSFSSASRPNIDGDGINATLLTGVNGGATTFTLLTRTEATGFAENGSVSVQGGGISAFTAADGAFSPLPQGAGAAPEPGTLSLLALAGFGPLGYLVRRKRSGGKSTGCRDGRVRGAAFTERT